MISIYYVLGPEMGADDTEEDKRELGVQWALSQSGEAPGSLLRVFENAKKKKIRYTELQSSQLY